MYQPYLICDVDTGVMGAIGAVLGLFHRSRTGHGQHISTSLTNVATLHQAIYLFDGGPDGARVPEPTGVDNRGWTPFQSVYRASDGWLFLAATPQQEGTLREVLGPDETCADGSLAEQIGHALLRHTRAHWAAVLGERGITVQNVREISDVAHDPVLAQRGVLRYARNGENYVSPVLGFGSPPWPVPERNREHPGPLGGA